jgi:hypothetical protein
MRHALRLRAAGLAVSLLIAAGSLVSLPILRSLADRGVDVVSREVVLAAPAREELVRLPIRASHVALRWSGAPDATILLAFGSSPDDLGEAITVVADEDAVPEGDRSYADPVWADGARWARVTSDRPLLQLSVVAIDADEGRTVEQDQIASAAVNKPAIITRAGWGANESYALNAGGYVRFAPSFNPLQKMIVHHTAGANNDPNPAATIRAIYYDHAVLRGFGDIDYNFLIDAQGRIYEGRRAWTYTPVTDPTGEDLAGMVVRGAHARNFNDATMGVSLLGNFTSTMPTTAARNALINLLAWKAERHGLNPLGASTYVNPSNGTTKYLYNISGHRNVNATACPGQVFYDTFATLRQDVAKKIASTTGSAVDSTPPTLALNPLATNPSGAHTLPFGLIFKEPVTGLDPTDFTVGGDSAGWSVGSIVGTAARYTVNVVADESGDGPADGSVVLTLTHDAVTDLAGHAGPVEDVSATVDFAAETQPPTAVLYAVPTRGEPPNTSFGISVTFDEPVTGFEAGDIVLGGSSQDATPWTVETLYGSGASYNFTVDNPTAANGTLTVQVGAGTLTDMAGNPTAGSNVISRTIDRSAPTTSTPVTTLRSGTNLYGASVRASVTWSGADAGGSGVRDYDVARSVDGAAFAVVASAVTGTAYAANLAPGHTYRFEVRARDRAGNIGSWKAGAVLKPALTQQTSTAVHWSGSSTTASSSSYSGGSVRYLRAAGAYATYTTSARSLSFVTTKGPGRGTARIYVDGVLKATVQLNASTYTYRFVAFAASWSSVGTHTIRVVSVGTPVVRVDVDAFGVIR